MNALLLLAILLLIGLYAYEARRYDRVRQRAEDTGQALAEANRLLQLALEWHHTNLAWDDDPDHCPACRLHWAVIRHFNL